MPGKYIILGITLKCITFPTNVYFIATMLKHCSRQDTSMFFCMPNSDPTTWMLQLKLRIIGQNGIFQSSIVQYWWICVNCSRTPCFWPAGVFFLCWMPPILCLTCYLWYSANLGGNKSQFSAYPFFSKLQY